MMTSNGFNPLMNNTGNGTSGMPQQPSAMSPSAATAGGGSGEDIPNDPGKMFIGGLSWQTTPESIREYFSAFGELAEVMVMKDPATRRSRGFGFITFSDPRSVEDVLKYPVHQLDGKLVEPKVAVPRKTNPKLVMRTRKIFVGGLSSTTSLEDIKAYFEQFSKVKEAMLAYDKITNRHRGFGFVTFDNEDVVDKICEIHFHEINGKMVESKKALPKEPRLGYYNNYGSPNMGYAHFSPGRHSMYGSYGGFGGGSGGSGGGPMRSGGANSGSGYQGYGGQHHQQYSSSYDHPRDQDRHLLQMSHFENANFNGGGGGGSGYDNDARFYNNMGKFNASPNSYERNNGYNKDFGHSPKAGGFGNYRESGRNGLGYDRNQLESGGGSSLLSNGYYSSRDFAGSGGGSGGHHHLGTNNNNVQPYSTSAGSGGSGENSAGYEDDFPELTTSKFNNLRLTEDTSPTSTPNELNSGRANFVSF